MAITEYTRKSLMASTTPRILRDDDSSWAKVPYQVRFGESFRTMFDALKYMSEAYGADVQGNGGNAMAANQFDTKTPSDFGLPEYFGRPFFKDTRLGMNDAINCLWQFNRDDDIVHPMMRSQVDIDIGEGRVYSSTIEQNQSLAWFTFGVPRFTKLANFYLNAAHEKLTQLNNTGFADVDLGEIFGNMVGAIVFALPGWILNNIVDIALKFKSYNVDRFYQLRPTMHLYYKYVDSILAAWLVNTGLYGNGRSIPTAEADGKVSGVEISEIDSGTGIDNSALPLALQGGASIWDILTRKCTQLGVDLNRNYGFMDRLFNDMYDVDKNGDSVDNLDAYVNELIKMDPDDYDMADEEHIKSQAGQAAAEWSGSGWGNVGDVISRTAFGATQFVGFRIEKSTDASESFSNSTGPSALAEQINNSSREAMTKKIDFGQSGGSSNTGVGILDDALGVVKGFFGTLADSLELSNLATVMVGNAFIDVPEQYTGSDFNKSHSLSFQLRAPYGDVVSIYQSIMVPLAMLLAGALPRAAGPNSYTQPFLCRVYSKGLFSIPMGIIDSISIKRGSSEFGWTYQNLPTCVDVSISIKDLSPVMYMGMQSSVIPNLFGTPSSFDEYLLTLAGVGLFERTSRLASVRRNLQLFFHRWRNTYTNPVYWAHWIGDSTPATWINAFASNNYISHR